MIYQLHVTCDTCGGLCEHIEKKIDGVRKTALLLSEVKKPAEVMKFLKANGYYICTRCGKKSWE